MRHEAETVGEFRLRAPTTGKVCVCFFVFFTGSPSFDTYPSFMLVFLKKEKKNKHVSSSVS